MSELRTLAAYGALGVNKHWTPSDLGLSAVALSTSSLQTKAGNLIDITGLGDFLLSASITASGTADALGAFKLQVDVYDNDGTTSLVTQFDLTTASAGLTDAEVHTAAFSPALHNAVVSANLTALNALYQALRAATYIKLTLAQTALLTGGAVVSVSVRLHGSK